MYKTEQDRRGREWQNDPAICCHYAAVYSGQQSLYMEHIQTSCLLKSHSGALLVHLCCGGDCAELSYSYSTAVGAWTGWLFAWHLMPRMPMKNKYKGAGFVDLNENKIPPSSEPTYSSNSKNIYKTQHDYLFSWEISTDFCWNLQATINTHHLP